MNLAEYLYPARPGMLRRGTPTFYVNGNSTDEVLHAARTKITDFEPWFLDLRDVTARAHAAMSYTQVIDVAIDRGWPDVILSAMDLPDACFDGHELAHEAYQMSRILARMRMLDETVTVAEARAALDWAHAASGGTR